VVAASLLVLGPATAGTDAPLAELLAIGIGGPVGAFAAVAAVLLTLGAMNAYLAGTAKLGAALGRDGAFPAWFARGSSAGEVPRRSLAVVSGLSAVSLAVVAIGRFSPRPLALLTTGAFVLVYVLGTAAAVRLLPRHGVARFGAAVALVASVGLLLLIGWYAVWTLLVAAAALLYQRYRRRAPTTVLSGQPNDSLRPGHGTENPRVDAALSLAHRSVGAE
jgi:amino acid efflux transporter